jgi:hypothetical protein
VVIAMVKPRDKYLKQGRENVRREDTRKSQR